MDGNLLLEVLGGDEQRSSASHQVLDGSRKHRTSPVLQPWSLSWIFFWQKLFAIYYTLSGGRLVEIPLLMQNLCLKLSLYFNRSYFTVTKMACKDDCWEGDYEEAKAAAAVRLRLQQSPNDAFGNR
jgi:hypothetical protein